MAFIKGVNLAGLGHRKQQAQGIVSVRSTLACQIFNRFAGHTGRGQGCANVSALLRSGSGIVQPALARFA